MKQESPGCSRGESSNARYARYISRSPLHGVRCCGCGQARNAFLALCANTSPNERLRVASCRMAGRRAYMHEETGGRPLVVDVALVPSLVGTSQPGHARTVYVVVDVIRATTTLCMLF